MEEAQELNIEELKPYKDQIDTKYIYKLLNYVRTGKKNLDSYSYLFCYNAISHFANKDDYAQDLLYFHNKRIELIIIECYEKIKNLSGLDFIDSFILYTERLNYFINSMSKIFSFINFYYLKNKTKDICGLSMDRYKKYFFDKLQIKLFIILNEILIREERNGNMEHRSKIQQIMKIISWMDLINPKIVNVGKSSIIWIEKYKELEIYSLKYQKKWFEYFKEETIRYIKNKAENDIQNKTIPEYIESELEYINKENERMQCYIHPIFHQEINNINNNYLIKNNMNKIIEIDTGANYMLKNGKKEELSKVYKLFKLYPPSLELLKLSFRNYLKECRKTFTLNNRKLLLEDKKKFIELLINLTREISDFVAMCFENNIDFQNEVNEEFCSLIEESSINEKIIKLIKI